MEHGGVVDTVGVVEMHVDVDADVDVDARRRLRMGATRGHILHGKDTPDMVGHRMTPLARTAGPPDSGTRSMQAVAGT